MVFAGLIKDIEAANAIGNAIAFPMMFLSGTFFPIAMMPSYLQSVARFLPLTYVSEGLKAAMITQLPEVIWFNTAVVGALAVVFILIGAYVNAVERKLIVAYCASRCVIYLVFST